MTSGIELVGRDQELAELDALLAEPVVTALLLEGEPGIGKTTLWRYGVERARDGGLTVLAARPGAAEVELGFSGLADLLAVDLGDALDRLPDPQRRALEVALLLADPGGQTADARAIGTAVLNVLRGLAAEGRVLLAIDDVQWLDSASGAALAFAARRLREEPIALLLARRSTADESAPLELDRALGPDRLRRVELRPLSFGALHHLLRTRLGRAYPRPTLRRIHGTSGGNPFYALELARALERRGDGAEPGIPIPGRLDELVRERIDALPETARNVLVLAAAHDDPTVPLLSEAAGADVRPALAAAGESGLIELEGEHVRFVHPVFSAAIYERAGPAGRHDAHGRLAALAQTAEERAYHASLAAQAPDSTLASFVEAGAAEALRRGAPTSAAELLERAVRITPESERARRRRRTMQAANAHFQAGTTGRALELLEGLRQAMEPGPDRAGVLELLALVKGELEGPRVRYELLARALAEAGPNTALEARILTARARNALFAGDGLNGVREAERAVQLAEELDDAELLAYALAALLFASEYAGVPVDEATMERALELERASSRLLVVDCPSLIHIERLEAELRLDEARAAAERLFARALDQGDDTFASEPLCRLITIELKSGDWECADRNADQLVDLTEQSGVNVGYGQALRAYVDAHLGRVEAARTAARNGIERARRAGEPVVELWGIATLGFLDQSLGDAAGTVRWFEQWDELGRTIGLGEGFHRRAAAGRAEALVALGRTAEARQVLDASRNGADATGRSWVQVLTRRADAIVTAAEGELEASMAELEAIARDELVRRLPFERARTLLVLGTIQRRAKRRRDARETLAEALAIFERLGARLWADKATAELARISGRSPSTPGLTETERRLAELVAEGLSNKEIAAALFLTPKTVGTKLSRIYAKVGVHSRTELVRRLGERATKV